MRTLIIGCGYVGMRLAKELLKQGHSVIGTCRSDERALILEANNIPVIKLDITNAENFKDLKKYEFDWVVNCAAPNYSTVPNYTAVYYQGNANVTNWLKNKKIEKYVFTGSTGVYGQNDGSIVTEESPTLYSTDTGRILIMTEELLLKMFKAYRLPVIILRVAGIYGEERGYYFKQFINGNAVIHGDGSRYLNMIHVDDVAGAIIAALEKGVPGNIYNVVDDEPVREIDFYKWLSDRLNMPLPPSAPVEQNAQTASGRPLTSNKRVSNRKLKEELGYKLKYPTFREGYNSRIEEILKGRQC